MYIAALEREKMPHCFQSDDAISVLNEHVDTCSGLKSSVLIENAFRRAQKYKFSVEAV